jgi:hypothetical protein
VESDRLIVTKLGCLMPENQFLYSVARSGVGLFARHYCWFFFIGSGMEVKLHICLSAKLFVLFSVSNSDVYKQTGIFITRNFWTLMMCAHMNFVFFSFTSAIELFAYYIPLSKIRMLI